MSAKTKTAKDNKGEVVALSDPGNLPRAFLQRMSNETLIHHGVNALVTAQSALREYEAVCEVLAERFPQERASEHILSPVGVARRNVRTSYTAKPEKMEKARKEFGPEFGEYFEEELAARVAPDMVEELCRALGLERERFLTITRTFKPTPKAVSAIRTHARGEATKLARYVDITKSTTVKIEPVNDGVKGQAVKVAE